VVARDLVLPASSTKIDFSGTVTFANVSGLPVRRARLCLAVALALLAVWIAWLRPRRLPGHAIVRVMLAVALLALAILVPLAAGIITLAERRRRSITRSSDREWRPVLDYRALITQADAEGWPESARVWRLAALDAGHDLDVLLMPSPPAASPPERDAAYDPVAALVAAANRCPVMHTPERAAQLNAEARARALIFVEERPTPIDYR
jgi:hypothetical protein